MISNHLVSLQKTSTLYNAYTRIAVLSVTVEAKIPWPPASGFHPTPPHPHPTTTPTPTPPTPPHPHTPTMVVIISNHLVSLQKTSTLYNAYTRIAVLSVAVEAKIPWPPASGFHPHPHPHTTPPHHHPHTPHPHHRHTTHNPNPPTLNLAIPTTKVHSLLYPILYLRNQLYFFIIA